MERDSDVALVYSRGRDFGQIREYAAFLCTDRKGSRGRICTQSPPADHERMGKNIFIGHPDIGASMTVGFKNLDRTLERLGNRGDDNGDVGIDSVSVEIDLLWRAAIPVCGLLDNKHVLLVSDAGNDAIVLHADEESTAAAICESGNGACNFAGIGYGELEVLGFVLALGHPRPDLATAGR